MEVTLPEALQVQASPELSNAVEALIGYPGIRLEYAQEEVQDQPLNTRARHKPESR